MTDQTTRPGLHVPRAVLEHWAGPMTDHEVTQLADMLADKATTSVIPYTSVPHAIATLVWTLRWRDSDAETCEECERCIPVVPDGAMANRYHDPACSLYDPDQD